MRDDSRETDAIPTQPARWRADSSPQGVVLSFPAPVERLALSRDDLLALLTATNLEMLVTGRGFGELPPGAPAFECGGES